MGVHKKFILSWAAGALLLLAVFYAAMSWLWSAARASGAASLESQVSSVLVSDLAEGNLFKLGATLSRLMQSGALEYAEIRSFSRPGGWERLYRTQSAWGDTAPAFSGFACGSARKIIPHRGEGVSLVTTLPSNIEGTECVALFLSSDLPAELKAFKNRLALSFGLLLAALFGAFLWLTISWHKKTLRLEVAAKTAVAEKEAAVGRMAAQVAHDIRSPLAALGAAAKGLELPADQRALIDGAVGRMQGIADDLLQRYRGPSAAPAGARPAVSGLAGLIEQVLAEKRLQLKAGVKLEFDGGGTGLKALVVPKEFQRLISNLLNNSLEALEGRGTVLVRLSAAGGKVLVEVKDDGRGIPPEILAKLGQKGETHGKAGGSGLGLYHARAAAEAWGGSLTVGSAPGKGTGVVIALPRPAAGGLAVLLDDDELVHLNWKLAAKGAGVELRAYRRPEEFVAAVSALPKDTPLYIDSELGGGVKGEKLAEGLRADGFARLTLVTGRAPEEFAALAWLTVAGKEPPWG